ncbi:probable rRNA-processing protein EBP2 [Dreissena polymorpha]|nr:probable rRNA-processing protein EBP2 [Dreissena polymorpha]
MVDFHHSSDSEAADSDEELQRAFAAGKLKPGLNVVVEAPKQSINNVTGMKQKLKELQQGLDWVERLDLTNPPAPPPPGSNETEGTEGSGVEETDNDFKRELRFYRQAQASVLTGLAKLHKLGIKTRRPDDYFAEMSKTDDHMKRIREKLLEKQQGIENRDKARKLRDLKKYGKKVQQDVLQKRHKEKREMLDAVKKFRKGQKDKLDFLEETEGKGKGKQQNRHGKTDQPFQPNRKRQYKNTKFGYGGQKKRGKMNTKESASDMSGFSKKINQGKPGKQYANKNKKGNKNKRPGKTQRQKMKNRQK